MCHFFEDRKKGKNPQNHKINVTLISACESLISLDFEVFISCAVIALS